MLISSSLRLQIHLPIYASHNLHMTYMIYIYIIEYHILSTYTNLRRLRVKINEFAHNKHAQLTQESQNFKSITFARFAQNDGALCHFANLQLAQKTVTNAAICIFTDCIDMRATISAIMLYNVCRIGVEKMNK